MRGMALVCLAMLLTAAGGVVIDAPVLADETDASSRPLPPRTHSKVVEKKSGSNAATKESRSSNGWLTTGGSLVIVVGLILVGAKWLRKRGFSGPASLPPEVVEVLGHKFVDYRHSIHLVRCGPRLLVLGASQAGLTTLAEITDPVEVNQLAGLCRPSERGTVPESFGQLLNRFRSGSVPAASELPEPDPAILRLSHRLAERASRVDLESDPPARDDAGGAA